MLGVTGVWHWWWVGRITRGVVLAAMVVGMGGAGIDVVWGGAGGY